MSLWQALALGLLQGATELFPVSSLGHAVLFPALLHWSYQPSNPTFLPFLVLLHLGTAAALFILFWDDWRHLITGFVRAAVRGRIEGPQERLAFLIVVSTLPPAFIGLVAEHTLRQIFAHPVSAGIFLVINGGILGGAEVLRRRDEAHHRRARMSRSEQEASYTTADRLSMSGALLIGASQALAFFPGISRSGVTMAAGLLAGLRHQEAARFSFLMATPLIAAAGLAEVPGLFTAKAPLGTYGAAAIVSGVAAYVSARFLIRYFRVGRLDGFAVYCVVLGIVGLLFAHQ